MDVWYEDMSHCGRLGGGRLTGCPAGPVEILGVEVDTFGKIVRVRYRPVTS
jgi:hypothetical protein